MKFFVSDLHLGDGSKADDFHREAEFLKFLNYAKLSCEELIIAGDLFELWQCSLENILIRHSRIVAGLLNFSRQKRLSYIIGNHDHAPFIKYVNSGLNIVLAYEDENAGLHAEHANQHDIFNRCKNPGNIISRICGLGERLIHPDFDEWATNAAQIRNKIPPSSAEYLKRGGNFSEYENAAMALINKGKRIVIFGHTHSAKLIRLGSGLYANCGAWSGSAKPTYVAVKDKSVEVRDGIDHSVIYAERTVN